MKKTLRELLLKRAEEINHSMTEIDENMAWVIQDYHSSYGEFNEHDFTSVKELLNEDKDYVFELVAPEEQLFSDDCDMYFEHFKKHGYLMD